MTSNDWVAAVAKLKASLRNLRGQENYVKSYSEEASSPPRPKPSTSEYRSGVLRIETSCYVILLYKFTGSWLFSESLRSALFWNIMRRVVVIPYRRFGTTYRSRLQGSRNPIRNFFSRVTSLGHIRRAYGLVLDLGAIRVIRTKGSKRIHREDWQFYALQTFPNLF